MNRELGSKAFTVGNDIHFNQGQYAPGTAEGRHLLAHELTHVMQQKAVGPSQIQQQRGSNEIESGDVNSPSTLYSQVYSRSFMLLWELAKVIHKQGQGANLTRTIWQEELNILLKDLGPPNHSSEEELKQLDMRLKLFEAIINNERSNSHTYFQELTVKAAQETRRLRETTDEMELAARAEELLNRQWQFTVTQVYSADRFLNHEDLMGLEEMLENRTHLQRARKEAAEKERAEEERRIGK